MAAATTYSMHINGSGSPAVSPLGGELRRRSIGPSAGRALELLGHAIEYLGDDFLARGGSLPELEGQIEAIEILMRLNRTIYLACPEVPPWRERWLRFLSRLRRG